VNSMTPSLPCTIIFQVVHLIIRSHGQRVVWHTLHISLCDLFVCLHSLPSPMVIDSSVNKPCVFLMNLFYLCTFVQARFVLTN
jgi:hypothetical protein